MSFRCTTCNGSMVFDIASQQMKCLHCGSICAPEAFRVRDTASPAQAETDHTLECPHCLAPLSEAERKGSSCPYCSGALPKMEEALSAPENLAVFLCENCGAELEGTEDSMIGHCPYCGSQSMVKNESREGKAVERIIPFKITRERCSELYQDFAKQIRYLPKDFKSSEHIQKFTGIYMPYYEYDGSFGEASLTGTKTVEEKARYDVVNTYSIPASIQGEYLRGAPFDASKYLDAEISRRAMPFDTTLEVDFHPAYLAGFYADASTVSPELYRSDAQGQAEKDVVGEIGAKVSEEHGIKLESSSSIETAVTGHHSVLFPMWFLTWRKENRVAYAVINGASGKVVSDLPLDLRAFWLGCGKLALVIFLLLELFFQPTPQLTSLVSLGAALCMGAGILYSTKTVYDKQMHTHDKGWNNGAPAEPEPHKAPKAKKPISEKKAGCLAGLLVWGTSALIILALLFSYLVNLNLLALFVPVVTLAFTIYAAKKVFTWQKSIRERQGGISITILLLTVVLNSLIVFLSPASDLWYYLGDGLCIAGLILSSLGMIGLYNVGTTRPLPKLFDRSEV